MPKGRKKSAVGPCLALGIHTPTCVGAGSVHVNMRSKSSWRIVAVVEGTYAKRHMAVRLGQEQNLSLVADALCSFR